MVFQVILQQMIYCCAGIMAWTPPLRSVLGKCFLICKKDCGSDARTPTDAHTQRTQMHTHTHMHKRKHPQKSGSQLFDAVVEICCISFGGQLAIKWMFQIPRFQDWEESVVYQKMKQSLFVLKLSIDIILLSMLWRSLEFFCHLFPYQRYTQFSQLFHNQDYIVFIRLWCGL